jgi:hypothetical protein
MGGGSQVRPLFFAPLLVLCFRISLVPAQRFVPLRINHGYHLRIPYGHNHWTLAQTADASRSCYQRGLYSTGEIASNCFGIPLEQQATAYSYAAGDTGVLVFVADDAAKVVLPNGISGWVARELIFVPPNGQAGKNSSSERNAEMNPPAKQFSTSTAQVPPAHPTASSVYNFKALPWLMFALFFFLGCAAVGLFSRLRLERPQRGINDLILANKESSAMQTHILAKHALVLANLKADHQVTLSKHINDYQEIGEKLRQADVLNKKLRSELMGYRQIADLEREIRRLVDVAKCESDKAEKAKETFAIAVTDLGGVEELLRLKSLHELDEKRHAEPRSESQIACAQPYAGVPEPIVVQGEHPPNEFKIAAEPMQPVKSNVDFNRIKRMETENDRVDALLRNIFTGSDDQKGSRVSGSSKTSTSDPTILGLDLNHSDFVQALLRQDSWSRAEFELLASRHHLMATGAIDAVNEAALDLHQEPLLEGDDPIEVNLRLRGAIRG